MNDQEDEPAMARKPIELTDEQRGEIETLGALLNQDQIADYLGIGRTTFHAIKGRDPRHRALKHWVDPAVYAALVDHKPGRERSELEVFYLERGTDLGLLDELQDRKHLQSLIFKQLAEGTLLSSATVTPPIRAIREVWCIRRSTRATMSGMTAPQDPDRGRPDAEERRNLRAEPNPDQRYSAS